VTARFTSVVDSGSPFCFFRADIGKSLGIDVESGIEYQIGGVIGGVRDTAYFHKVKVYVETAWLIEVKAGFMQRLSVPGILGRNGFFDNFHVRFDHSCQPPEVEVSKIEKVQ
jgi:hypothetical protein